MNCDEVRTLHGPYLDSELDAKTSLEIEQHLKTCPGCARLFAKEEELDARLMAGLNRGPRTAALWAQIERDLPRLRAQSASLNQAAGSAGSPAGVWQQEEHAGRDAGAPVEPGGWRGALGTLGAQFRAGWRTSRWAWAGLAVVWVVILALNFAARQPDAPLVAGQQVPSASEIRFAVKQKQLLMAELAVTSEPVPAEKPKAALPSPRSDRRNENLNA